MGYGMLRFSFFVLRERRMWGGELDRTGLDDWADLMGVCFSGCILMTRATERRRRASQRVILIVSAGRIVICEFEK